MANMLATGASWLDSQRHANLTSSVTYSRGSESVSLAATIGRSVFRQIGQYGEPINSTAKDFLLRATDLIIDDTATEPQTGDTITFDGVVFEVMPFGDEPTWRWSDDFHTCMRIHTKDTGVS